MSSEAMKRARATYRERHKTKGIYIEIPEEEATKWKEKAEKKGMKLTEYIRSLINTDTE